MPGFDLAVSSQPQRFTVGLFTQSKTDIGYGDIGLRFRHLGEGRATGNPPPFGESVTATFRLLPGISTTPPGTTPAVLEPSQGRGLYVALVSFDRPGFWEVEATAEIAGAGQRRGTGAFDVGSKAMIPSKGEPALKSTHEVLSDKGDPKSLDSRASVNEPVPDPELHRMTIAEAVSTGRPTVITFSTPTYCTSRFCGPVTDVVSALERRYRGRVNFIHVEIWTDHEAKELNPAAREWLERDGNLQEPWTFLVATDGVIKDRWDNAITEDDLVSSIDGTLR